MKKHKVNINKDWFVMLNDKKKELIDQLEKCEWNPNISEIAKNMGKPISSVHDFWRRIQQNFEVEVTVDFKIKKSPESRKKTH